MPIVVPDPTQERGRKDALRHHKKQEEAIKKNLPEIIANENIITGGRGKIIKIPIRAIDIPHFRPHRGEPGEGSGIGQGNGQPGDTIGSRPVPGREGEPGGPGQEPGEDFIDAEKTIAELIEIMLEDLGLPRLEERSARELLVDFGWRIAGRSLAGPPPLRDFRETILQGFKRFWSYLQHLQDTTKRDELTCFGALKEAAGVLNDALKLLKNPDYQTNEKTVTPFSIPEHEDQRFYSFQPDIQHQSRAVVIAMMDVSVSMDTDKKYYARSMLFWMVEFLRHIYKQVEVRFITHHASAQLVDEKQFFETSESGGTQCYTAYEMAGALIDGEYPTSSWNVYLFHFSDGEDFSVQRTVEELRKCVDRKINMFGFGQVNPHDQNGWDRDLFRIFGDNLPVTKSSNKNMKMLVGADDFPFLAVRITQKDHIYMALREILKKDRWKGEHA